MNKQIIRIAKTRVSNVMAPKSSSNSKQCSRQSKRMESTETDEYDDLDCDFPWDQLDLGSAQFASQIPLPIDRKRSGGLDDQDELNEDEDLELDFLNDILAPSQPSVDLAQPAKTLDELALVASPTKSTSGTRLSVEEVDDIEDIGNMIERVAPFFAFRKKGFFSVSDLVGPLWCEVQYDYRLRTLPFLPVEQRPTEIVSDTGKTIKVDKKVVENHEKVMKKGNVVHKKLEREIHPEEIKVSTSTREDVWGLRFLNMLSSLEALLTLGKCRELPVVGFIKEYMVVGVIDEIIRQPVPDPLETTPTKSKTGRNKAKAEPTTPQPKQISLTKFLKPLPSSLPPKPKPKVKTHDLFVSDSKTRASGTMPRPENTQSGQMQLMLYKELLDGLLQAGKDGPARKDDSKLDILPSFTSFSFVRLFTHLGLDSTLPFSSTFQKESRAVVKGNGLRDGAATAKCLDDMVACWTAYVERLSLGPDPRSDPFLELVYRRTGRSKLPGTFKKRRRVNKDDQDRQLQLVVQESLRTEAPLSSSQVSKTSTYGQYWTGTQPRTHSEEREESELAAAVEMSMVQSGDGQAPIQEQDAVLSEVAASDLSASTAVGLHTPLASSQAVRGVYPDTTVDDSGAIQHPERDVDDTPQTDSSPPVTPGPRRSTRLARHTATPVNLDSSSPVESTADTPAALPDATPDAPEEVNPGAGSIIGKHRFCHSETKLAAHLNSVLAFWIGERAPVGVKVEDTTRCGWCEFEEGCEWRAKKADEALAASRARATQRTQDMA